jgi:hypothetical protein
VIGNWHHPIPRRDVGGLRLVPVERNDEYGMVTTRGCRFCTYCKPSTDSSSEEASGSVREERVGEIVELSR